MLDSGFSFGGQYLWVEAEPADIRFVPDRAAAVVLQPLVSGFQQALAEKLAYWRRELADAPRQRVALWGAGAKATMFLNLVANGDRVARVVDVNPRKLEKHVPGTGHRIEAPTELVSYEPTRVLITNSIYRDEISAALATIGSSPHLEAV